MDNNLEKYVYFVTAIFLTDKPDPRDETKKHPHNNSDRCFGYFFNKESALNAVEKNYGDMHECLYNYLVIEWFGEGVFPLVEPFGSNQIWFKWAGDSETGKWVEINAAPKELKHVCNFAIG